MIFLKDSLTLSFLFKFSTAPKHLKINPASQQDREGPVHLVSALSLFSSQKELPSIPKPIPLSHRLAALPHFLTPSGLCHLTQDKSHKPYNGLHSVTWFGSTHFPGLTNHCLLLVHSLQLCPLPAASPVGLAYLLLLRLLHLFVLPGPFVFQRPTRFAPSLHPGLHPSVTF